MLKIEKKRRHLMTSHVAVRPGYNRDVTPQERGKTLAQRMKAACGRGVYLPWKGRDFVARE